jgi:hypothetical protein
MRMLSLWLAPLFAVSVAGCKGRESAPACEPTLAAAVDRMVAEAKRSPNGGALARAEASAPALRQALLASCAADEWSATALRCFTGVALPADLATCTAKLTHEQYVRVHQKIDPLLAPAAAAVTVPPASGSGGGSGASPEPAAGSGTGGGAGSSVGSPGSAAHGGSSSAPSAAPAAGSAARPPAATPRQPPPPDCSLVVVEPTDPRCRAQYCRAHPADLRCAE